MKRALFSHLRRGLYSHDQQYKTKTVSGWRSMCQAVTEKHGESRIIDPVSSKQTSILYLDTLNIAKRLRVKGFSQEQAETITEVLAEVVGTAQEHQTKKMVTKPQQEIMVQQLLAQIASVKKDMVILEKSEFTMIRNDTEKQGIMLKNFENKLKDDIKKLEGQVKLDINLEKSRAIEAHALNEKNLQKLINKLEIDAAEFGKTIHALGSRIDLEVSNLRTIHEKNRNDMYKYFFGTLATVVGLYFGYLRLVM